MTRRYQIRDEVDGLALYDAESAVEALAAYFGDRRKGELRPLIRARDDGSATVTFDGVTRHAVLVEAAA